MPASTRLENKQHYGAICITYLFLEKVAGEEQGGGKTVFYHHAFERGRGNLVR